MDCKTGVDYLPNVLSNVTTSLARSNLTYEQIIFMNMENAEMILKLKSGTQVNTTKDLYN